MHCIPASYREFEKWEYFGHLKTTHQRSDTHIFQKHYLSTSCKSHSGCQVQLILGEILHSNKVPSMKLVQEGYRWFPLKSRERVSP